jgi:hypothetical protein
LDAEAISSVRQPLSMLMEGKIVRAELNEDNIVVDIGVTR